MLSISSFFHLGTVQPPYHAAAAYSSSSGEALRWSKRVARCLLSEKSSPTLLVSQTPAECMEYVIVSCRRRLLSDALFYSIISQPKGDIFLFLLLDVARFRI